jgi:hypothetical protein
MLYCSAENHGVVVVYNLFIVFPPLMIDESGFQANVRHSNERDHKVQI